MSRSKSIGPRARRTAARQTAVRRSRRDGLLAAEELAAGGVVSHHADVDPLLAARWRAAAGAGVHQREPQGRQDDDRLATWRIALAEINQSVLVIDADMRRPRLHSVFDVKNEHGLSDLLLEKSPLDAAELEAGCVATAVPGLYVLPSGGSQAQRLQPAALGAARRSCWRWRASKFDTVIVDTPPMVNIADARVVARFGDATILVVRSGVDDPRRGAAGQEPVRRGRHPDARHNPELLEPEDTRLRLLQVLLRRVHALLR